jgi:hypothetical protein
MSSVTTRGELAELTLFILDSSIGSKLFSLEFSKDHSLDPVLLHEGT